MTGLRATYRVKTTPEGTLYLCMNPSCSQWKPDDGFHKVRGRHLPVHSWCKSCRSERRSQLRRARTDLEELRARERERQKQRRTHQRLRAQGADTKYRNHFRGRPFVPADLVRPWLEELLERHGEQKVVESLTGVQVRVQYRLLHEDVKHVELDTADRLAIHSDNQRALEEIRPVTGRRGWNRAGDVACVGCGTWWHPHQALGRCSLCYMIHRGSAKTLPRDQRTGWSIHYPHCLECKRIDRQHQGRGLCYVCRDRAKREGRLDQFPPLTKRKPGNSS